jgi:hypothetical protein
VAGAVSWSRAAMQKHGTATQNTITNHVHQTCYMA